MIKLADLIEQSIQPGEEVKMKNFLYRGSRDQINLYQNDYNVVGSKPGTIEGKGMLDTSNHPENKNRVVPFQWDQPDGIFEDEQEKIHTSLIGREFQTLEDIKKIASRLRQAGFVQSDIEAFVRSYLLPSVSEDLSAEDGFADSTPNRDSMGETVGWATITKPADPAERNIFYE